MSNTKLVKAYDFDGRIIKALFYGLDVKESTSQDYRKRTMRFLHHCKRHGGITPTTLLEYKRMLAQDSSLGVSAKNKYLSAARIAIRQMHKLSYIPVDLSTGVKNFQQTKKHKRVGLNADEMERVGSLITDIVCSGECRTAAIVALLTYQGLRQIEICGLSLGDLDLANKKISITGKGCYDSELVDMHPCTDFALSYYLANGVLLNSLDTFDRQPLFPSRKNPSVPISTRQVRNIITDRVFKPLDITKTVHGIRHYYTTQLIRYSGGNLLEVSQFTRHRSLEMLQTYYDETETTRLLPQFHDAIPAFPIFASK